MSWIYTAPKPRELYIDDNTPNIKSLYSSKKIQELVDWKLNSVTGSEDELLVIWNNWQIKTSNETLDWYSKISHTHQWANISIDTSSFWNNLSSYEDNLQSLADRIDDLWIVWEQWPQGIQWLKWDKWDKWEQGIQGIKWDKWEQGIQWPAWVSWPKWDKWIQWEQGIQGIKWDKWDTWSTWNTWPQWNIWPQWIQWEQWPKWDSPTFEEWEWYNDNTYLYVVFWVDNNWVSNRYTKTNLVKTTSGTQNNTKATTLIELQNLTYN